MPNQPQEKSRNLQTLKSFLIFLPIAMVLMFTISFFIFRTYRDSEGINHNLSGSISPKKGVAGNKAELSTIKSSPVKTFPAQPPDFDAAVKATEARSDKAKQIPDSDNAWLLYREAVDKMILPGESPKGNDGSQKKADGPSSHQSINRDNSDSPNSHESNNRLNAGNPNSHKTNNKQNSNNPNSHQSGTKANSDPSNPSGAPNSSHRYNKPHANGWVVNFWFDDGINSKNMGEIADFIRDNHVSLELTEKAFSRKGFYCPVEYRKNPLKSWGVLRILRLSVQFSTAFFSA